MNFDVSVSAERLPTRKLVLIGGDRAGGSGVWDLLDAMFADLLAQEADLFLQLSYQTMGPR